jgi:hypothetical protein
VDEKSQIQALDRTQPGLPLKGRAATMTHDYKRNGVTTLNAAMDVQSGIVIGACKPRHRAREFIAFLRRIDRCVQRHLDVHVVLDNSATRSQAVRVDEDGRGHPQERATPLRLSKPWRGTKRQSQNTRRSSSLPSSRTDPNPAYRRKIMRIFSSSASLTNAPARTSPWSST